MFQSILRFKDFGFRAGWPPPPNKLIIIWNDYGAFDEPSSMSEAITVTFIGTAFASLYHWCIHAIPPQKNMSIFLSFNSPNSCCSRSSTYIPSSVIIGMLAPCTDSPLLRTLVCFEGEFSGLNPGGINPVNNQVTKKLMRRKPLRWDHHKE